MRDRRKSKLRDDQPEESARALREGSISRVAQQKHDPDRVSVFIDDEFAFGLAMDLAIKAGLKSGMALSVEAQQALLDEERDGKARTVALNYVSYQARTVEEVRRKLREKGYETDVIDDAVLHLFSYGYLDDEAYAMAYVRSKFSGSGYGPRRLSADLAKRGVDRGILDRVIVEALRGDELKEAALQQGRKRWDDLERETDLRKRKKKVMDFLVRRGFDFGLVREVVDGLSAQVD